MARNRAVSTAIECLHKPDQYKIEHMILHAAAVLVPTALAFWTPYAAAVSIACWGIVILVIGGHGEKALGGNLGASGISVVAGGIMAPLALLSAPLWLLALGCGVLVAAMSWLTEYHQNGGHWCGQDRANFHNRLTGAGIGTVIAAVFV